MPSSELESKLESKSSKDDNENDDDTHCDDQEHEHEHEHEEEEYDDEDEDEEGEGEQLSSSSSKTAIVIKCILACVLLYGALIQVSLSLSSSVYYANPASLTGHHEQEQEHEQEHEQDHLYYPRRRLSSTLTTHIVVIGDIIPSYMNTLITDLMERKKLFDDTPPEEIKYWFEYTGPLQVRFPFPFFFFELEFDFEFLFFVFVFGSTMKFS
jgi:hypothetical protein